MGKNFKIEGAELEGLTKLKEVLEQYKQHYVKVGVLGGNAPSGESYASIAMLHEYGSESPRTFNYKGKKVKISGVPTRSFIRMPIRTHLKKLKGDTVKQGGTVQKSLLLDFKHGYTGVALKLLGMNAEAIIQEAFDTQGFGKWPANISEKYIELKGSDTPLIDTGRLRAAVTSQVVKKQ